MTDPQTPATEAGRRHLQWLNAGDDVFPEDALATILAIEAEARAEAEAQRLADGETIEHYVVLLRTARADERERLVGAVLGLRTHQHPAPNGADMPSECVMLRDVEAILYPEPFAFRGGSDIEVLP